jgi:hypothetical protein
VLVEVLLLEERLPTVRDLLGALVRHQATLVKAELVEAVRVDIAQ